MADCCPIEQTARQARLEQLYRDAGRENTTHPLHGLYTGLHIEDLKARAAAMNPEPAA